MTEQKETSKENASGIASADLDGSRKEAVGPFDIFAQMGKVRTAIEASEYETLEDLAALSDKELGKIKGVGPRAIAGIRGLLADSGHDAPETELVDVPKPKAPPKTPHPSTVKTRVGKIAGAPGDGKVRSLVNAFMPNVEGHKVRVSRNQIIQGNINPKLDLPPVVVKYLVDREEAA